MPIPASKILVLHGPNLNLLGSREPDVYGRLTLAELNERLTQLASDLSVAIVCRQSNAEGQLIDWLQGASLEGFGAVVLNPGGYGHTSVALRDAVAGIAVPVIEVHLSNIHAREEFRHHSHLSAVAAGVLSGLGVDSYLLGLRAAVGLITVK